MAQKKYRFQLLLPAILILGGLLRLLFLVTPHMDSDQAVTGLMARHILGGEFPFFFYGQDYCGSIEAYLVSTVFWFFGATRFTLNLTIGLESLFFIAFIYFLARHMVEKETALLAALYAALSSYYLIFHSVLARAAYIEIPIIGVLLFIVILRIGLVQGASILHFFILGFFSGLGIWTHFLTVFYLPPVFLFWFSKDRWFWIKPGIVFFLIGLLVGGLPLWAHNIAHPLVTWHYLMGTAGGDQPALTSLKDFFLYRFPEALGLRNNDTEQFIIPYFSFFLYIVYLALFLGLLIFWIKALSGSGKFRLDKSRRLDLLLLFLLFFPVIFSLSGFASAHTSRYLQPLFSALPILFAFLTQRIYSFSTGLALLFLVLSLFSNVYGTITRLPLVDSKQLAQYRQARTDDRNLISFLKSRNIHRVYSIEYWNSVRLTFDAQEEVIFANPVGDRYPHFTALVDRARQPAFLFAGDSLEFENTLLNLGGTYRKTQLSGYCLYHDFSPPAHQYLPLDSEQWTVVATHLSAEAYYVLDKNLATRWSAPVPPGGSLSLQLDLGKIISRLGRITLLSGKTEEVPRNLRIEVSSDGHSWQLIKESPGFWADLFWSGPHPFYRPQLGRIDITFSPCSGRFLRITQTGGPSPARWSVAECFIYQEGPKREQSSGMPSALLSFINKAPSAAIYTTPWIQAHWPDSKGFRTRNSDQSSGEGDMVPNLSDVIFVVDQENAPSLADYIRKNTLSSCRREPIGSYEVFFFPPSTSRYHIIPNKNWHFQTNAGPQKAYLAADGKLNTRWTTDKPQVPGIFFRIDLGRIEEVNRLRLLLGDSKNDFPRGAEIVYSTDGLNWKELMNPTGTLPLYWTGEILLRVGGDLELFFPTIKTRYLEIRQTGRDDVYYWSIHEIEIYKRQEK
jgi:4-amino-4-deoxy-L-arabinose transferase-like glycosyltransferase